MLHGKLIDEMEPNQFCLASNLIRFRRRERGPEIYPRNVQRDAGWDEKHGLGPKTLNPKS